LLNITVGQISKMVIFCKIFSIEYSSIVHCTAWIVLDDKTFAIQLSFFCRSAPYPVCSGSCVTQESNTRICTVNYKEKSVGD